MKRTTKTGVYTKNGEEINFTYYTSLRAYDKLKFVNFVTNTLIDGNYNSVIRDMIFDMAIVHIMTDIDASDIIGSVDAINNIEDFLDETNIVDIVYANASGLINELNDAVDKAIEYRTGIHKNPIADSLSNLLNTLEKKVSGVDTDSMMKMAQVLSKIPNELTADKLVAAYSKSDLFKQKHGELTNKSDASAKKTTRGSKKTKDDDNIIPMK